MKMHTSNDQTTKLIELGTSWVTNTKFQQAK